MSDSKLTFYNLKYLVTDMKRLNIYKENFKFNYAKQIIDCVFCINNNDYELLVGVHKLNLGFVIELYINKEGNFIGVLQEKDFFIFRDAMNLKYSVKKFTSNALLVLLSEHVPVKSKGIVLSFETMRKFTKCRKVNEADKIYFKGWNDHVKDGKTARNFKKTEFFFGKSVANYCRKHNISSMWTDIPNEEKSYHLPHGFDS